MRDAQKRTRTLRSSCSLIRSFAVPIIVVVAVIIIDIFNEPVESSVYGVCELRWRQSHWRLLWLKQVLCAEAVNSDISINFDVMCASV